MHTKETKADEEKRMSVLPFMVVDVRSGAKEKVCNGSYENRKRQIKGGGRGRERSGGRAHLLKTSHECRQLRL